MNLVRCCIFTDAVWMFLTSRVSACISAQRFLHKGGFGKCILAMDLHFLYTSEALQVIGYTELLKQ
jgi:hypothetical protein